MTPTSADAALIDDNPGNIDTGGGATWYYEGQANEILIITTNADWDTTLTVRQNGEQIAFNDDADGLPNNNSRIHLTLPEDGSYEIEVRSYNDRSGGEYTLIIESDRDSATTTPTATTTMTVTATPTPE